MNSNSNNSNNDDFDAATSIDNTRKQAIMSGTPYVITKQFPWKLHEMLDLVEQRGVDDIVSWLPDGRSFRVHMVDTFVKDIMKESFNQTKYKSFQRQLNLWGFERNTKECPEKGAYYHPLFVRGRRDLCKEMSRKRIKGDKTSPAEGSQNSLGPFLKDQLRSRPDSSASSSSESNSTNDSSSTIQTAPPPNASSDILLLQQLRKLQQASIWQQQQHQPHQPHQQQQHHHHHQLTPSPAAAAVVKLQKLQHHQSQAAAANLLLAQASIQDALNNAYKERSTMEQLLLIQALQEQERSSKAALLAGKNRHHT